MQGLGPPPLPAVYKSAANIVSRFFSSKIIIQRSSSLPTYVISIIGSIKDNKVQPGSR
jgi:hypothetical protein